jgi:FixJ family two-component response regulator
MNTPLEPLVIVILPELEQCEAVCRQVRQRDWAVRTFLTFGDCLKEFRRKTSVLPCCVVCPLAMGGLLGLPFQRKLRQLPQAASIVFFDSPSAMSDVVEAMRRGAVAVVEPSDDLSDLMAFIEEGLEQSCRRFEDRARCRDTLERLRSLNLGEHHVLQGVIVGKLNKEIARELKVSIRTIEQRRGDMFRKMGVQNAALLVRKVMGAIQTSLPHSDFDEQAKWLETVRKDLAHPLISISQTARLAGRGD